MDTAAAARVPWIAAQWDLIDLQIGQRGGRMTTSCADNGVLRLRKDDNFRIAILFFNGLGEAVNPAPARLRWSLRDAANLELISTVMLDAPSAQTDQSQPYFLMAPDISRLGSNALDLLPEGSPALPCLMDVDWVLGGKVYSSTTMPVIFEFGLGAKVDAAGGSGSGGSSGGAAGSGSGSDTPPVPPVTPEPPTLADELPIGEGFLYVKNGRLIAVPAGDCTTGQKWSPTT